jgi:outer membrane protein assembly factor BamD
MHARGLQANPVRHRWLTIIRHPRETHLKNQDPSLTIAVDAGCVDRAAGAPAGGAMNAGHTGAWAGAAGRAASGALRPFARRVARLAAVLLFAGTAAGMVGCATSDYDPTANWTADRLYADAKAELESGNWGAAITALQKLESRYPFGRYAQQAQLDLAWASYKEGERAEALVAVDRFIRLHPTHDRLDYAFYLKGLINFNNREGLIARIAGQDLSERDQQASREAYESFKQVVTRFPESRYAEDAYARMKFLVNSMASGEVHIARYYYSRGAYVAAANRAQDVVSLYQQTPATEEALNLMVMSYAKLGLAELRDDALRVLERNFPNSRFLPAARRAAAAGEAPAKTASN